MNLLNSCSSRWLSSTKLLRSASSSWAAEAVFPPAVPTLDSFPVRSPFSTLTWVGGDDSDTAGEAFTEMGGGGGGYDPGEVDDESDGICRTVGGPGRRIPFTSAAYGEVDEDADRWIGCGPLGAFGLVYVKGGPMDDGGWLARKSLPFGGANDR